MTVKIECTQHSLTDGTEEEKEGANSALSGTPTESDIVAKGAKVQAKKDEAKKPERPDADWPVIDLNKVKSQGALEVMGSRDAFALFWGTDLCF